MSMQLTSRKTARGSSLVACVLMACVLVACLLMHGQAHAEPWVVVPVVVGGPQDVQLAATHTAKSLAQALSSSTTVMSPVSARERFEQRGSSAPIAATHTDLDQIARDTKQALYHVAMGLYTRASSDVERVMTRADRALESLNREALAARQLLDSCLFIVRARLAAKLPDEARKLALECRRLVPDIAPDASMHPPNVIGELAAAEAELEMQQPGSLRVTSAPSGCPVFVQGRNLGQTPLELPRLTRGEYRVQAECVPGQFGRVHRVTLGPSRTVVHVDSRLDAAVQTGDGVSLAYSSQGASDKSAAAHAVEVGRTVGAALVALVIAELSDPTVVQVLGLEVQHGRLHAAVRVRMQGDGGVLGAKEAMAALVRGESLDFTVEPPVPFALPPPALPDEAVPSQAKLSTPAAAHGAARHDADAARTPTALGWTLAATGLAAHLAGYALYINLLALDSEYRSVRELPDGAEALRRLGRVQSFEAWPLITAGAGTAVMTASLPWLLPAAPSGATPAWAWGVGGAGVALAATGGYLLARGAGCDAFDRFGRCDDVASSTRLGGMLLGTALPMLAAPVVYFIRDLGAPEGTSVSLDASQRGFALQWRGQL